MIRHDVPVCSFDQFNATLCFIAQERGEEIFDHRASDGLGQSAFRDLPAAPLHGQDFAFVVELSFKLCQTFVAHQHQEARFRHPLAQRVAERC